MQVSLKWLNELVDLTGIEVAQVAHELTMSGLEVEEVEELKPKFTNIITARIEKIDQQESELILKSTVTAFFRDINFTVTADLTLNTLKVKGGENDGKTVVAVGGVEVKTLSQLCAVMLGYTAGGKGEALLVTLGDGTSVELDARNNLI